MYTDLGPDASMVGPWLWPDIQLADVGVIDLPMRHGVSEIHAAIPIDLLFAHLTRIRHLVTHDGQRYFVRYADMRALSSLQIALDDAQWRFLVGPITNWSHLTRDGTRRHIVDGPLPSSHSLNHIELKPRQLAVLLDAGLPDLLSRALEELEEPGLCPESDASQYAQLQAAADLVRSIGIESFPIQRSIARQAALHGAQAIQSEDFLRLIEGARWQDTLHLIDAWKPSQALRRQHEKAAKQST